jgi:phosphoglycerate dehydrogenase-like enzyme
MQIAILDDYQKMALQMADWSNIASMAEITVFHDILSQSAAIVERLLPFDVICVMRERTPLTREIIESLPRLKLIASTGPGNGSIDMDAARERGISVTATGYWSSPTIELTWALILASARHIVQESNSVVDGGWQGTLGLDLARNIGREVARIGRAFGMTTIAWSENLTPELAADADARLVTKEELFQQADIVTIHLRLSERTRGLVGAAELGLMKPTARLINTSRGPIVDEAALITALQMHAIAGAALDVFDDEPLPPRHPFRSLNGVLATPHLGYVTESLYRTFYGDVVASISAWLVSQT